jgi:hypothetical protein
MPMLEIESATKDNYRATFSFLLSTFCTPNFMAEKNIRKVGLFSRKIFR